jgi:tricarballylate dehydrogenase
MTGASASVADLGRRYDVLVIGGGNAGLCAAVTARESGAGVLLLECAPRHYRGGNSRHTRNLRYLHDATDGIMTGPYREDEFWDDLRRVTAGQTDERLARLTIQASADLGQWLGARGVRFQPALGGTLQLGRTNAFLLGGGKALVNALYRTAEARGVEVVYEAEAQDLAIEDGRFVSARVALDGALREVRADALVVAAGGFEANIPWLKQYWGDVADNFIIRGTPYNQGRVLRALLDGGARPVGDPTQCHAVAVDGRAPKFDGGIVTRVDCVPLGIVVNRDGRRFYDEGEDVWPKRYAIWGRLVAQQPGQIAHVIIDQKAIGRFIPPAFPPIEAGTIRELAGKLGLDPATLQDTVTRFNAAVRPGTVDWTALDDCRTEGLEPPKSHWALPLDAAPFHAYPLRPGITFTYLGVAVNEQARLIMADRSLSENIFAAGEIMAGNVLSQGYLAGIGMTIGSVFGRIAGREAAAHAGT